MAKSILLFLCCFAVVAIGAVEYDRIGGIVRAVDNGKVLWQNQHDCSEMIADKFKAGPVVIGEYLYYSIGEHLYQVEKKTGIVVDRIMLPGFCAALRRQGEKLAVEVKSFRSKDYSWKKHYMITAGQTRLPLCLSGKFLSMLMPRRDANSIRRQLVKQARQDGKLDKQSDKLAPAYLQQALLQLQQLSKRDPSNLWYIFEQGTCLHQLGRSAEAIAKWQELLTTPEKYHLQLLGMVHYLDQYQPALADQVFTKGMKFLLGNGYEPEMMHILIAVMVLYGAPLDKIDPSKNLAQLNKLGQRIWDLAPYTEASCFFFNGLAQANAQSGNVKMATIWKQRRDLATPHRVFAGANRYAEWGGHALNLFQAVVCTLLALLLVKFFYNWSLYRSTPKRNFSSHNFFSYWSKPQLLGFLAIIGLGWVTIYVAYIGIQAVGYAAAIPSSGLTGFFNHPDAVEHFAGAGKKRQGKFVYALLLHKSGDTSTASRLYRELGTAPALNNLGVIAHGQGNSQEARKLFAQALSKQAGFKIAAFNLGHQVTSPRIARLTAYGQTAPLLAIPTARQWSDLLAAAGTPQGIRETITLLSLISDDPQEFGVILFHLFLIITALAVLAVVALFQTGYGDQSRRNTISYWLGVGLALLFPGSDRKWSILGPFLLVLFFFSLVVGSFWIDSGGRATNIIETIPLPSAEKAYGISAPFLPELTQTIAQLRYLWWILLGGNILYLAIMYWLKKSATSQITKNFA